MQWGATGCRWNAGDAGDAMGMHGNAGGCTGDGGICSPIYVLCVSSHFWPSTKEKLGLRSAPRPPLVGHLRHLKSPLTLSSFSQYFHFFYLFPFSKVSLQSKHLKACLGPALVPVFHQRGSPWQSVSPGFPSERVPLALR